jgi:hypothetical protein
MVLLAIQLKATVKTTKTALHKVLLMPGISFFLGKMGIILVNDCHTEHNIDTADPEEQLVDNISDHVMKGINSPLDWIQTGHRTYTLQFDSLPDYDTNSNKCYPPLLGITRRSCLEAHRS